RYTPFLRPLIGGLQREQVPEARSKCLKVEDDGRRFPGCRAGQAHRERPSSIVDRSGDGGVFAGIDSQGLKNIGEVRYKPRVHTRRKYRKRGFRIEGSTRGVSDTRGEKQRPRDRHIQAECRAEIVTL